MYCEFFGFKEKPFTITPNPRFIFLSKNHKEAFAHLLYGIESRAGFIELTGEVGSGKTTILRSLLGQLDETTHRTALVFNPRLSAEELLRTINREYGIPSTGTIDELMHSLNQFLLRENSAGHAVVLVIDEAQNLDPAVLEQIRMISNLETNTDKLIQIVLAGQPELGRMLENENLRQLSQRIMVRFHLPPLDFEDMCSYIDHRLEVAGGWRAATIAPRALKLIFSFSKGLPRLINILCDRILLIAFTEESRSISPKMVKQAVAELRREQSSKRFTPWMWRSAALAAVVALLVVAGFIAGRAVTTPPLPASETKPGISPAQPVKERPPAVTDPKIINSLGQELAKLDEITCAMKAFNEMARLWDVRPVVSYEGLTVRRGLNLVAGRRGLNLFSYKGDIKGLLNLNRPSLMEVKIPGSATPRFLALVSYSSGEFTVVAPASGRKLAFSEAEIATLWNGRALVPGRSDDTAGSAVEPQLSKKGRTGT